MSNVVAFARKTAASKLRVSEMAESAVAYLDRAQQEADRLKELQRIRNICLLELGLAFQKMYVLLGLEETDRLVPWLQSSKREEHIMKLKIKGSE